MGTSNEDLLRTIRYYQDSLEKYSSNGNNYKVLSAIKKLQRLPIATSHLEDTGIGRTVNSLRKLGGEVGDAAKALVSSWKEMVLQEDVKKDEADKDVSEEYENNIGRTSDETEMMDAKYRHKEKSSSHKSSDEIKSEKERYNIEKKYDGNIKVSADKKDNRDRDSNRYKYERTSSSKKYKSKEKNVDSDSNSESESENDDSEHTRSDSQYGSDSESDNEGNGSSDAGKIGEKYSKDVNRSSRSKSYEGKKHKYDNNDERHNSKRKHCSDSSESDDDRKNGSGYKSKSHVNESDEEGKRKVDKSSSSKSSRGKKDSRDKEKSAKKHKHEHDDTTKRHSSKRKYESVSNSESDEEEKNCKKKHSRSDEKHTSDSEEDDDEEVKDHKIKHRSDSADNRKDHHKSQNSKSHRHEASSSNSKSGEKTESKTRESSSSSKGKSSSKSKSSKKEESEDRSSSKHKSRGGHNSSEAEERSRSKHERDSKDSKTHSSHSSRHDRKDKDKHSHRKEEFKRHEEKERNSKSERDGGKKEKSSGSSSSNSKSSGSKHKSTSEKSSKAKDEPKRKTVIVNGIDSESGASFAEALGMCGPMSFSKVASGSKKKSSSQSSPDKHSKNVLPSTSTKTEKPERTEEKYVPNLLKEQPPEPLPLNISSLLPEISPNYKPVAFPLDSHPKKYMTPDEALSQAISNKNLRTKVYSGNKTKGGDVDSLFTLCVRVLQDNLDAMECTGGVPYHILKPILEKATPDQLFNLEHYNPYLIEDTDELWRLHCTKEFRTKKREEMETWREMYMRCLDEREAKLNFIKANIKESQDKSLPVRTTKLAYVDSVAKPPRNIARKQAKNGIVVSKTPVKTPSARLSVLATSGEASKVSVANPGSRAVDRSSSGSSSAIKPKKAPLMAKTLSLFKNRFKR